MALPDVQVGVRLDAAASQAAAMLALGKSCGYSQIELAGCPANLLDLDNSQVFAEQIAPLVSIGELVCVAFRVERFSAGHLADADPRERHQARDCVTRLIEMAGERRIRRVSIAPATVAADTPRRVNYQDALNRTTDAMDGLARLAERSGVQLCLRASAWGFLTSPPELRELAALINSPALGVDLDASGRSDPAHWKDWLATLEPYVGALGMAVDPHGDGECARSDLAALIGEVRRACAPRSFGGSLVLRARNG